MSGAKRLPSGNYRVLVYIGKDDAGKRRYKSITAPSKKDAEYAAAIYAQSVRHSARSDAHKTLSDAIDDLIQARANVLSPTTKRGYRIIQRHALRDEKDTPLERFTDPIYLQKFIDSNSKKYKWKSLKNQLGLISNVLNMHALSMPKNINIGAEKTSAIPVPSRSELIRILQLVKGDPIEAQVLLAVTCSLTQSEIAALTPSHIEKSIVHVRGARVPDENNAWVIKPTNKTSKRRRDIEMPAYLSDMMASLCAELGPNELIFTMKPNAVLSRLKKLCKENDMPEYTMHAMRHAFAAWMHNEHIPDQYIMQWGGWASPNTMQRVYQYAFADEAAQKKRMVNASFEDIMTHTPPKRLIIYATQKQHEA